MVKKDIRLIRYIITFYLIITVIQPVLANSNMIQHTSTIFEVFPDQNIQKIIDSAPNNATLLFQPGIYTQPIRVSKPMRLAGTDKNNTFFLIETKPNNPAISISSPHVSFSQFSITNTASGLYTTAIKVDSPLVCITNCRVEHTPIGIAVWNENVSIIDCSFINCSDEGILLISTSISSSTHNLINHCQFSFCCDGIELQQSSYNTISNCDFENNAHAGIDAICDNNNGNIIINCSFLNNDNFDIYFASSNYNQITACSTKNNDTSILFTPSLASNTVSMNSPMNNSAFNKSQINTGITKQLNNIETSFQIKLLSLYEEIINLIEEIKTIIQNRK